MQKFSLAEETLGYVTSPDESNTDRRLLVGGSKNVLIDYQKKVKIRSGYTRLGAANTALTQIRNAWTWHTSNSIVRPQRFYDDELEVYLRTIDGVELNAWYRVGNGFSTTEMLRAAHWYDDDENIDLQVMVNGDDNLYEWGGGVAVMKSATSNTITKQGTTSWLDNRFYSTRNKVVTIDGTDYTYTGGETTTTLTGVTPDPSSEAANSVAIQKVLTTTNSPQADRNNHFIASLDNQIYIGSSDADEVFISNNDTYALAFSFSSPRVPGEGALLTLDNPTRGFGLLGKRMLIFSGRSSIFAPEFKQLDVGGTLTETLEIEKIDTGIDQGAFNQESIVPIGDALAYLTNEPALRIIDDKDDLKGLSPKRMSNPIKPDFDAEDWTNAFGIWYKNSYYLSAQANSRLYILSWVEDSDGKLFRFWNPPQTLPVEAMSIIDSGDGNDLSNGDKLHIHSNSVPETYLLFDGASDGKYAGMAVADKLPIDAKAIFAYNNYKQRALLKVLDEYYTDGEITPNTTDLTMKLRYDFGGATQELEFNINGNDESILEGSVGINSLAQQSLATNPLGGLLNPPDDARRFRWVKEIAKEDFFEIQVEFSTNEVDRYWAVIAHGANTTLSRRKATDIRQ